MWAVFVFLDDLMVYCWPFEGGEKSIEFLSYFELILQSTSLVQPFCFGKCRLFRRFNFLTLLFIFLGIPLSFFFLLLLLYYPQLFSEISITFNPNSRIIFLLDDGKLKINLCRFLVGVVPINCDTFKLMLFVIRRSVFVEMIEKFFGSLMFGMFGLAIEEIGRNLIIFVFNLVVHSVVADVVEYSPLVCRVQFT